MSIYHKYNSDGIIFEYRGNAIETNEVVTGNYMRCGAKHFLIRSIETDENNIVTDADMVQIKEPAFKDAAFKGMVEESRNIIEGYYIESAKKHFIIPFQDSKPDLIGTKFTEVSDYRRQSFLGVSDCRGERIYSDDVLYDPRFNRCFYLKGSIESNHYLLESLNEATQLISGDIEVNQHIDFENKKLNLLFYNIGPSIYNQELLTYIDSLGRGNDQKLECGVVTMPDLDEFPLNVQFKLCDTTIYTDFFETEDAFLAIHITPTTLRSSNDSYLIRSVFREGSYIKYSDYLIFEDYIYSSAHNYTDRIPGEVFRIFTKHDLTRAKKLKNCPFVYKCLFN